MDFADVHERIVAEIAARARIEPARFDSIAEVPVYEILDSLDVVEVFAAVEAAFNTHLDPNRVRWESQPSVGQFAQLLAASVVS